MNLNLTLSGSTSELGFGVTITFCAKIYLIKYKVTMVYRLKMGFCVSLIYIITQ